MKRGDILIMAAALLCIVLYLIFSDEPLYNRIAGAFFIPGMGMLLLGLACYVRNGGIFKITHIGGYRRYRNDILHSKKIGRCAPDYPVMDFTTYCLSKYEKKWNAAPFFVCAVPCLLIAFGAVFLGSR